MEVNSLVERPKGVRFHDKSGKSFLFLTAKTAFLV